MGYAGVQLQFFAKRRDLPFLRRYRAETPTVDFQNIEGLFGAIVASGKATLHELKTIYSLEDAWLMWEVIAVTRYNEYLAVKDSQKKKT